MFYSFSPFRGAGGLLLCALLVGCGTKVAETVQQTAAQVQQSVTNTVDSAQTEVKEQLQLVGSSELTIEAAAPVKTPSCYATFTPATNERPSILSLQSYRAADKEAFPSFYLQASVTQATLSELVGQTVPAVMYVKTAADAPTWHTATEQPVQLKVVAVEDKLVTAEVVGGTLARTDGQETKTASGKFVGVLP